MEATDCDLVRLARQGDRKAFDALTVRYWPYCRCVAALYTRNWHDAEDQTQNAFLKAYIHLDQCHDGKFYPWLNKIVENECRMQRRWRKTRPEESFDQDSWRSRRLASREPTTERMLLKDAAASLLRREVARLPLLFRDAMRLHCLDGLSQKQASEQLGITVGCLKSRLVRGHLELRTRLITKPAWRWSTGANPGP